MDPALGWSILDSTRYQTGDLVTETPLESLVGKTAVSNFVQLYADVVHSILYVKTLTGKDIFHTQIEDIVQCGFDSINRLVVVQRGGNWRIYEDFKGRFTQFQLPFDFSKAQFAPTGSFMALCTNGDLVHAHSQTNYTVYDAFNGQNVDNFWFKQDSSSLNQCTLVQINNKLHKIGSETTFLLNNADVMFLDISPNLKFVALVTNDSKLYILASNDLVSLVVHDINLEFLQKIQWCGSDSIVLCYQTFLQMYGPTKNKHLTFYPPNTPIEILNNQIGLYVSTPNSLQIISKVSQPTLDIFQLGSNHPGSILLDAYTQYESLNPNLTKTLGLINDDLTLAIDTLILASLYELEPYWQKRLLRAAKFGKSQLEFYNSDQYIQSIKILQVINNLHLKGLYLTYDDFDRIGLDNIVDILLLQNEHSLCLSICDKLSWPKFKIWTQWAISKISQSDSLTDDQLLTLIQNNLKDKNGIDWSSIAHFAHTEGRQYVCKKLLLNEPNIESKCQMLLDINEPILALELSSQMGTITPIINILTQMKKSMTIIDFFKVVNQNEFTIKVLNENLNELFTKKELDDFYYQRENYIKLIHSNDDKLSLQKISSLCKQLPQLKYMTLALDAKIISIDSQSSLDSETVSIGEPINKTISKLFIEKNLTLALSLARKNKIPNLEICYIYLTTITLKSSQEDILNLIEFSQSNLGKHLPIEEYFYHMINLGDRMKVYGGMFVKYFKNDIDKVNGLILAGLRQDALLLARQIGDEELIGRLAPPQH